MSGPDVAASSPGVMHGPEPPPPPVVEAARAPQESKLGALFWDQDDEIDPDDPDMAALLALQEETPPEERAEAFKDRGNESMKLGTPFHCRQAAACYTQALAQGLSDPKANSVFHANRAQAHLQLRNWGKALADGRAAVELHPGNVKAAFRAAKAAAQLGKHDEVLHMCSIGLQSDSTTIEFQRLRDAATAAIEAAKEMKRKQQEAAVQIERLAAALEERHLRLGPPRFGGAGDRHKPWLDPDDGRLRFRMVLMYPESEQTDLIEEMCEDDVLGDHLDAMFGPDAPPLYWDTAGQYTRDKLDVYYHVNLVPAYSSGQLRRWLAEGTHASGAFDDADDRQPPGDKQARHDAPAKRLALIDQHVPLGEALAGEQHVIPGTVVLFVLSRGTEYAQHFLAAGLDGAS